ncbi:hypothetical protein [Neomicrococcus aestuarii]|jgi:hypothetical protein|uniref:Uncharacterized protein n=1 Tax=Neomicrococcus aestuarii TaxID=556325 RepID=A0A1L2ZNM4_9MICC|nr:hypothetical protein [Neomicrococcus aestuarii]APF40749.1 hypothetical protein BHE16_06710 [Neomicrococcus aestuarii]MBB5512518.1 hypothetical protein [Neomicrococcus aestuarii]
MTTSVVNFISYCHTQIWRHGFAKVYAVIKWVIANWRTVASWIARGDSFYTIIVRIINIVF